jgi:hypothetical protein
MMIAVWVGVVASATATLGPDDTRRGSPAKGGSVPVSIHIVGRENAPEQAGYLEERAHIVWGRKATAEAENAREFEVILLKSAEGALIVRLGLAGSLLAERSFGVSHPEAQKLDLWLFVRSAIERSLEHVAAPQSEPILPAAGDLPPVDKTVAAENHSELTEKSVTLEDNAAPVAPLPAAAAQVIERVPASSLNRQGDWGVGATSWLGFIEPQHTVLGIGALTSYEAPGDVRLSLQTGYQRLTDGQGLNLQSLPVRIGAEKSFGSGPIGSFGILGSFEAKWAQWQSVRRSAWAAGVGPMVALRLPFQASRLDIEARFAVLAQLRRQRYQFDGKALTEQPWATLFSLGAEWR